MQPPKSNRKRSGVLTQDVVILLGVTAKHHVEQMWGHSSNHEVRFNIKTSPQTNLSYFLEKIV